MWSGQGPQSTPQTHMYAPAAGQPTSRGGERQHQSTPQTHMYAPAASQPTSGRGECQHQPMWCKEENLNLQSTGVGGDWNPDRPPWGRERESTPAIESRPCQLVPTSNPEWAPANEDRSTGSQLWPAWQQPQGMQGGEEQVITEAWYQPQAQVTKAARDENPRPFAQDNMIEDP
eukprot:gene31460-6644_t